MQNPLTNTVIQYLESRIHSVESIPRLSWIPLHGAKDLLMMFINTVTGYETGVRSSRSYIYKFYVQFRDLQRIISYSNNSVKLKLTKLSTQPHQPPGLSPIVAVRTVFWVLFVLLDVVSPIMKYVQ